MVRTIWESTFHIAPARVISGLTPARVIAPCYHLVSDRPPPHIRHLYDCRNVNQFKAELDWLLKRFKPISLNEISSRIAAREPLPDRSLFLSFDDGLRECIDVVAPICSAKGVPATFFIATAFVGNRSLCYRHKASLLVETALQRKKPKGVRVHGVNLTTYDDLRQYALQVKYADAHELDECAEQLNLSFEEYLESQRPYLNNSDITALIRHGFSIGGHSVDHPLYALISEEQQAAQTRECLRELKTTFHLPVSSFAFPFVADGVSERFIGKMLAQEAVDLLFYTGALRPHHDGRMIWRFGVEIANQSFATTWKRNIARQQLERTRTFLRLT